MVGVWREVGGGEITHMKSFSWQVTRILFFHGRNGKRDEKCFFVPEYVDSHSEAYIPLQQRPSSLYTRPSPTALSPLLCNQNYNFPCAWLSQWARDFKWTHHLSQMSAVKVPGRYFPCRLEAAESMYYDFSQYTVIEKQQGNLCEHSVSDLQGHKEWSKSSPFLFHI